MKYHILFVLSLILACNSDAYSAEVVVYDSPSADSYVLGAEPDVNFGDAPTFQVRNSTNRRFSRVGYIQFDLNGRLNSKVEKAKLSLVLAAVFKDRPEPSTVSVYGWPEGEWEEGTLTNENAFWKSDERTHLDENVHFIGKITVPPTGKGVGGTPFSINSEELANFLETARVQNTQKLTFLLVEDSPTANVVTFVTKENASFPPTSLEVTLAGK